MNLPIYIHGLIINHTVKVADNLFHSLLVGADFLRKSRAVIDYNLSQISFEDGLVQVPLLTLVSVRSPP